MELILDTKPLNYLTESSKPMWGIMTPQHMVEHLIQAVQLSNGKLTNNECMNPPEKLKVLKRFLLSPRPLPKNFVNTVIGPELKPLINNSLADAIKKLNDELDHIENYFTKNPEAKPINPTFGPLNKEEWIKFHIKHFNHHFEQFGLMGD